MGSSDRDSGGGGHWSADNSSHTAPLMKLITDLRYMVIDVFESDRGSLVAAIIAAYIGYLCR